MLSKIRRLFIILCVSTLTFLSLGIATQLSTRAESNLTTAEAIEEFVMEEGASIRKSTDNQGIRFNALLSTNAYNALKKAGAEFGMLILPKDYVTEGYELTVENVFGDNAVYVPNVKASELLKTDPTKKAIVQIENPTTVKVNNTVKIYGSIVGVLENNIDRGFIGRAYVCLDGVYYLADYANGLVDNNTRSMAYVAQCAINDNDSDKSILQSNYIDRVKNNYYDYTVNEITVDLDGSVTKTVLKTGNAKFGTPIVYKDPRFGFENAVVDSFVSMQNAEFNVIYLAKPINIVVDADASKTELYAANELADYVKRVTGKAVSVGTQSSPTNNIFISTDTTLGLATDSFRLSTDANGNIHINGKDDRGTLYGVYEFEEKNLGVKFLSETYTHVPVTNKQIASLTSEQERDYVPAFAYRTYMNNGVGMEGDANVKYSSHLRFVSQFSQEKAPTELMHQVQYFMPWMAKPWLSASHSLITYAAIGAYKSGRTDLVNATFDAKGLFLSCKFTDKAISDEAEGAIDNGAGLPDVCYSSATAREWVIAGLKYMIDTYGDSYDYFMLGQADKTTECDCSTCKKAIVGSISNLWSPPDNKSDLVARFIRDVVTAVNKNGEKYSNEKIVMFAYQKTEPAPKHEITDMPDNVYIQWAPIDQDRYFALNDTNPTNWQSKIGIDNGNFLIWSYETDFGYYFNYYPTMHTWVDNFQTYKDLGVEAIVMQSTWNTAGVADSYLDAYVASKLLWNFESNSEGEMEALINSAKEEFIQYFYGDAAKDLILQYYNDFDALYQTKFGKTGYIDDNGNGIARTFAESDLNALLDLINQAIAKTTDETYLKHLTMLSFTPRYMLCQYCSATDDTLLNDMNEAGVSRSREGTNIEDDSVLSGFLMFKKGGTEIKTVEYDANGRISHLTLEIPDNCEWTSTTPSFTAKFMQSLYADGVRTLSIHSNSTAKTGNFIYTYNAVENYFCSTIENISLTANGTELRFSYVDVSGSVHGPGGKTIGTTLDLYFNYNASGAETQNEIGLTVSSDVRFFKNSINGEYVISHTSGADKGVYFSANQVNTWLNQGYKTLSLTVEFEASADIDQTASYDTNYRTDKSGYSAWTFNLIKDTPIKLWAQKNNVGAAGVFVISNVELSSTEKAYITNYSKLVSDSYDENSRLTQLVVEIPAGINWWETPPQITASYLNGLYADGVRQVIINTTSTTTTNNFYTTYGSSQTSTPKVTLSLTENGSALQFSYVILSAGGVTVATTLTLNFTYIEDPAEVASKIGATLKGNTVIAEKGNGSYLVSNAYGDSEGLEFSATQVNEWINQGYHTLSMHVSFTHEDGIINKIVGWSQSTSWIIDETGNADWVFPLKQNEKICLWTQFGNDLYRSSFTISNLKLTQIPEKVAAEIGITLTNGSNIEKDGIGSYVLSNVGMENGAEGMMSAYFSAEQVNEWISQGYGTLKLKIRFTTTDTIDQVVGVNGATFDGAQWFETTTGSADWSFTLTAGKPIQFWAQKGGYANSGAFTLHSIELTHFDNYYTQGYATVTNAKIENSILLGLTATFKDETSGWEINAPTLTAEYLNYLYGMGIRAITINVTGNKNNFLTRYNGNLDWTGTPIQLIENGGALEFSHLDVSAGNGLPSASTLTLTFKYGIDSQVELGAKAIANTVVFKNVDGSYDVYNTYGMDKGLEFTANQVNTWLDAGYSSISLRLSFTAVADVIDEVVVYGQSSTSGSIGYIEDYSGMIDLTLILNKNTAIYIWTQVNHSPELQSTFTLSNFKLNHYSFSNGFSTVIDETVDENGRLTSLTVTIPDGTPWWVNSPTISGDYLKALYAAGIRKIVISGQTTNPSVPDRHLIVVHYQDAVNGTDFMTGSDSGNNFTREITLTETAQYLSFAFVYTGSGSTVETTLTLTFSYSA